MRHPFVLLHHLDFNEDANLIVRFVRDLAPVALGEYGERRCTPIDSVDAIVLVVVTSQDRLADDFLLGLGSDCRVVAPLKRSF